MDPISSPKALPDENPKGLGKTESSAASPPVTTQGSSAASVAKTSRAAIIISIISALIAGLNFYYSSFRAPAVEIQMGSKVLITSKPRIGGWFTLSNSGAQPTTVTSATLQWDTSPLMFTAAMTSRNLDEWYFDDRKTRQLEARTSYSLFSPIPLVGHSDTSSILWFTCDDAQFKFTPGNHIFKIAVFNGTSELTHTTFRVLLSDADVAHLDTMNELPLDVQR